MISLESPTSMGGRAQVRGALVGLSTMCGRDLAAPGVVLGGWGMFGPSSWWATTLGASAQRRGAGEETVMSGLTVKGGVEEHLAVIAGMLYDAADLAQASTGRDGSTSADQLWALGLSLAASQAAALMTDPTVLDAAPKPATDRATGADSDDFLGVLRATYEQACALPIDPQYPGISQLIVTIGDLTRQGAV